MNLIREVISNLKNLKICILDFNYSKSGETGTTLSLDPQIYLNNSEIKCDRALIDKANIYTQINKLRKNKYDLYINLCCYLIVGDIAGFEVIRAL